MRISTAVSFFQAAFFGLPLFSTPSQVTHKVVQRVPENYALGVIVDNDKLYPLSTVEATSTLYHTGEAPRPTLGYRYAIIDKDGDIIIEQESFLRSPVIEDSTLNEYYNRTWNLMTVDKLPVIMKPLPILDRIKSDLHLEGQIPTIHITGNQTAIDIIHHSAREDIRVPNIKVTYIR